MAKIADRVKETTTTTGTGSLSLAGAATRFRAFQDAFSVGDVVYYAIVGTTEWEGGIGTLSASTTLTRDTVLSSSNANALVSFSAGTKTVFVPVPATHFNKRYTRGRAYAAILRGYANQGF